MSYPRRRWVGAAMLTAFSVGCGSTDELTVFDEISRLPTREQLVEVDLGSFVVPVPMVLQSATERFEPDNLMQVEIDLVAIVDPDQASHVKHLRARNSGRLRDRVIRVCRNTTRDDLLEAEKVTLKAHLLDAVQPMLGGPAVRRLCVRRADLDAL